jgi:hypothetical protein
VLVEAKSANKKMTFAKYRIVENSGLVSAIQVVAHLAQAQSSQ